MVDAIPVVAMVTLPEIAIKLALKLFVYIIVTLEDTKTGIMEEEYRMDRTSA
jgi:hypothetical protein